MDAKLRQWNDGVLAALLFAAPLIMGGRHPLGRLAIAVLAVTLGGGLIVRWTLNRQASWIPMLLGPAVASAAVLLVALQLLPLPADLLTRLVPAIGERLPLWLDGSAGTWRTISMHPASTREALAMVAAYALLFFAAAQQIESLADIERWLRWIAFAGIGMAVLGLVQYLAGADKFLWLYEHPTRGPGGTTTGPFANRNHFAHFLVLCIGPVLYQFRPSRTGTSDRNQNLARLGWAAGLTIILLAVLLSRSRGGLFACGLALATAGIYLVACGRLTRRGLLASGLVGGLLLTALAIHGGENLQQRLSQASQARSLSDFSPERADLWSAHLAGWPGSPWFGYGAATHLHVYRTFMPRHYEVQFTHGESGYMPLLLETGACGLAILGAAFLAIGYWLVRTTRERPLRAVAGAIAPGIVASAAQSLGDFVWYIPACLTVTLLLIVCLARLSCFAESVPEIAGARTGHELLRHFSRNRFARPLSSVPYATAVIATLVSVISLPHLIDSARSASAADNARRLARLRHRSEADKRETNRTLCRELDFITKQNPDDARSHLLLAQALIAEANWRRSENKLPLAFLPNLFDDFTPRQIRDYLDTEYELIVAAAAHTRAAIASSPLEGDAYVLWSDLHHLTRAPQPAAARESTAADITARNTNDRSTTEQWLDQALKVRPHSGAALMRFAQQAALRGDLAQATTAWREVFTEHPQLRGALVERLWPTLPQSILLQIFDPDAEGLLAVHYQLKRMGEYESAKELAPVVAEALAKRAAGEPDDRVAAEDLSRAGRLALEAEQYDKATEYGLASCRRISTDIQQRLWLADLFERQKQYAQASEQLEWVLRRTPRDPAVREKLLRMRTAEATANAPHLR